MALLFSGRVQLNRLEMHDHTRASRRLTPDACLPHVAFFPVFVDCHAARVVVVVLLRSTYTIFLFAFWPYTCNARDIAVVEFLMQLNPVASFPTPHSSYGSLL